MKSLATKDVFGDFNHRMTRSKNPMRLGPIVNHAGQAAGHEMSDEFGSRYLEIESGLVDDIAVRIADAFVAGVEWVKTAEIFAEENGSAGSDG